RTALAIEPVPGLRAIPLKLGSHTFSVDVLRARMPGSTAPVYLVDAPALYARSRLYTADADEHLRFIVLTHAALLSCQRLGFAPQILHCNDWHTGLAPLLLKTVYAWDALFRDTRS